MISVFGFLLYLLIIPKANSVLVDVEDGTLEGEVVLSFKNNSFYSFKGIPYAVPPIGKLRFKAPEPLLPWTGIRSATAHGSKCPQKDVITGDDIPGDEDCLFLNVYSPKINPEVPLPVMVFIHGGGFRSGSGNDDSYGPSFLLDYGIVLVTINYRLEILGFLSLENDEVPGNAGMKDQVAALKWVQKNIKKFGGDPDNVTIFGQSAGGASVAYHLLSPMSKGLYHRAISMSGVPFCDWAMPFRPRERAFVLGKQLGIVTNDTTVLLQHLRNLSSDKLYDITPFMLISETLTGNTLKMYPFVPVVESTNGKGSFLSRDPIDIIKDRATNKVDLMIGFTEKEALPFSDTLVTENMMPIYDRYNEMLVPTKILRTSDPTTILDVSHIIRDHYFSNRSIDISVMKEIISLLSDSSFAYDIIRFTKTLPEIRSKSRYMYRFSAISGRNYYGNVGLKYGIRGPGHLDDLQYLFDAKALNLTLKFGSDEYKLVDRHCTFFTNFAKYGNPTPHDSLLHWPQYDSEHERYMEIGNILQTGTHPGKEMIHFWKSIFDYARIPFYP